MGLVGFVRTLLFIIAFYYIFKFIGRYVMPYLVAKGLNKMTSRMADQQRKQQNFAEQKKREEGKVTIQATSKKGKKTDADLGDYVDYEEVK
ncbi:DUF4834 family protein [Labilibacter marinus]|uniref:DUF4834 family protein n=1 Tax=Labilibacter marinus TaxID=1477105 RepID=UPI0008363A29|nr:DUF4834 family protein [Labilibacter marinus]